MSEYIRPLCIQGKFKIAEISDLQEMAELGKPGVHLECYYPEKVEDDVN